VTRSALTIAVLCAALAAGAVMRVIHPGDIEYKDDERYTFGEVQRVLHGGSLPALGMPMSVGPANPGMSIWIFVALGWITGAETPPQLARAVQAVNVIALGGLVALACFVIAADRRETWLWAAALWAVNPLAIVLERKIWAQSVLPIFTVALVAAWLQRRRPLGSLLAGVLAAVAAQIHMSGGLLAAALVGWTAIGDRRSVRWLSLGAGAAVASLPALPWISAVAHTGSALHRLRWPFGSFYKYWLMRAFGFGAEFPLGPADFSRFVRGPVIDGQPAWLLFALLATMAAIGALLLVLAAVRLAGSRWSLRGWVFGSTESGRLVRAVFWGFGGLLTTLTIVGAGLFPHYLEVAAPVISLWVASLAAAAGGGVIAGRERRLLAALCVCNALVAGALLAQIHSAGGSSGDFGPTWARQQSRAVAGPGK